MSHRIKRKDRITNTATFTRLVTSTKPYINTYNLRAHNENRSTSTYEIERHHCNTLAPNTSRRHSQSQEHIANLINCINVICVK